MEPQLGVEWNGTAAGCRMGVGVVNGMEPQLVLEWNGTAAGCRMGVGVVNGSGFLKFRKSKAILPSDKSYVS